MVGGSDSTEGEVMNPSSNKEWGQKTNTGEGAIHTIDLGS